MKNDDRTALLIHSVGLFWGGVSLSFYGADSLYRSLFNVGGVIYGVIAGAVIAVALSIVLILIISRVKVRLFLGAKKVISISMVVCFLFIAMWELYFNRAIVSADGAFVVGILFSLIFYTVDQYEES